MGVQKVRLPVLIRKMRDSDINDVMAIEAEAFSVPWTRDHFLQELDLPEISNLIVAEAEGLSGAMVGYACYSLIVDEAHITNFAVRDIYRRKGIGEQLLHHLLDRAIRQGARRATLEVRLSNQAARWLYEKFGFSPVGIRKAYYPDNKEDALVMWANLSKEAFDTCPAG